VAPVLTKRAGSGVRAVAKLGCYLVSVAGALTAGSFTGGRTGLLISAVLVVVATPVIGFTLAFLAARPGGVCMCQVLRWYAFAYHALPSGEVALPSALAASGLTGIASGLTGFASDPSPPWSGLNCSIFLADIVAFGCHQRNDKDRQALRTAMYAMLRQAFESSGISWEECHREDRGDGALVIVPPGTPTSLLIDPMPTALALALADHNDTAMTAQRMQLRIALHVGPVVSDREGVCGESVIVGARLLDAPILKQRLATQSADLGMIVSAYVYHAVVKHGPGTVDPARFRRVHVRVKESRLSAWICLLGGGDLDCDARRGALPLRG